jgi:hypothetical protein
VSAITWPIERDDRITNVSVVDSARKPRRLSQPRPVQESTEGTKMAQTSDIEAIHARTLIDRIDIGTSFLSFPETAALPRIGGRGR